MDETSRIKRALKPKSKRADTRLMLSSGSTMLNLACTGRPFGCFIPGNYYQFIGDSDSGKTFLVLTALAEANINKRYNSHRFIYDAPEAGALMDWSRFFGEETAARIEAPAIDSEGSVHSSTIEEFYFHVDDALNLYERKKQPFIYILDSMDSLSSKAEEDKFKKRKNAHRAGREESGTMTDGKAKINSAGLRQIYNRIRGTENILIIISQSRDNMGLDAKYNPKVRAGGRALKFYAALEMWTSTREKLRKDYRGKKRQQGILAKVQVKKNRITGRDRTVLVPIYHSMGVDDIGSVVDYLLEEGHWKKGPKGIKAGEFNFIGTREELITRIDRNPERRRELKALAGVVWNEVEDAIAVKRTSPYR